MARPPVSYSDNDFATALVGERDAVVHQLFKVVVLLRLLELEVATLGSFEPLAQLFVGGWHGSYPYNSPRKARCWREAKSASSFASDARCAAFNRSTADTCAANS